jgi:hypothetical protein
LNVSKNDILAYYIGENKVLPEGEELTRIVKTTGVTNTGRFIGVGIARTVDIKLADPYSECSGSISSETSDFAKQIIEKNVTYRQVNCNQLCFEQYKNNSKTDDKTWIDSFDYKENCSKMCPLECNATSYETVESQIITTPDSITSSPSNAGQQSNAGPSSNKPGSQFNNGQKPDLPCFGVELSNCLQLNFYLVNRKYVEISQIVKTTLSDFVSNTGGVLGLFLELSFLSIYKFIVFVYTIIF